MKTVNYLIGLRSTNEVDLFYLHRAWKSFQKIPTIPERIVFLKKFQASDQWKVVVSNESASRSRVLQALAEMRHVKESAAENLMKDGATCADIDVKHIEAFYENNHLPGCDLINENFH